MASHQPPATATDRRIDGIDEVVTNPSQKGEATRQSKLPFFPVHKVDFAVLWVSLQALEQPTAPRAMSTALMSP